MGARWMKKNMNRAINEKYFNDPVQNAAFICCIDVLAELVEKYGDKVLDTISDGVNSSNVCDYIVVNGRFCPQSVRSFCPIVAGFNAGTYKVPACVL